MDHRQAFGETHGLVRLAVAIGVLEAEDIVARLHAGHRLRVGWGAAYIKSSLGVPRHLGGLGHTEGLVGEQVDLEAFGDLESSLLLGSGHDLLGAHVRSGLRRRSLGHLAAGQGLDVLIP